jgi:hypothetical protein
MVQTQGSLDANSGHAGDGVAWDPSAQSFVLRSIR